ncbi:MAG: hypothetical protein DMG60_18505 [Acidobacteria bacterium]|nr:MAG: hypothetical protein DMG60_18505 [Acidobacteriota bacterium]
MGRTGKKILKLKPLDEERREFLRTRTERALSESPYLKRLHDLLVEIGGEAVVLWNGSNRERLVNDLIGLGKAESAHRVRMQPGEPGNCHENSRRLASERPQQYLLCTGYALSKDSVWRPHSWVWDVETSSIVETTEERIVYFGLIELSR